MNEPDIDDRIASRLRALRGQKDWSLDELAGKSGVSRATLSRLEKAEVSATATVLNRICAAYGLTMSRLMVMIEHSASRPLSRVEQAVWTDPEAGFVRRSVSPPAADFAGEVIEGELAADTQIAYATAPRPGLEHHLVMLDGALAVTVDGERHDLRRGDCLRYRLFGPSLFETGANSSARYLLFML